MSISVARASDPHEGSSSSFSKGPTSHSSHLLWNPENVRDVADSVGAATMSEEVAHTLAQDVEYRLGQVIIEAVRFMRIARRTTLTVQDVKVAMRALDVEPLYGYDSTRPLRFGEASLGPGQPLFYAEDEEIDFEKLINAPLPKVPRDMSITGHWLSIEGVQPAIPQNPSTSDMRSQELLPKGPGSNPVLPALAGNQIATIRPAVKHVLTIELHMYFEKIQAAVMDENTEDDNVLSLCDAALESVASDPGIHQLIPYFVNFIAHEVTQQLGNVFILRQMMRLTEALISNPTLFLDPYASPLTTPVLTCVLSRKLGNDSDDNALEKQYNLRDYAASLVGKIAQQFMQSNKLLRPKITRSCLKNVLDLSMPPAVWYGGIRGLAAAGGAEAVRLLAIPIFKDFENHMLQKLKNDGNMQEYNMVLGAILKAMYSLATVSNGRMTNGVQGITEKETNELKAFVGEAIGDSLAREGNHQLVEIVLDARDFRF